MHAARKRWIHPTIEQISLAQAREKIFTALKLIDGNPELAAQCAKLKSILDDLDTELGELTRRASRFQP